MIQSRPRNRNITAAFHLKREIIESKNKLLWRDSRAMRHCATVRLRRFSDRCLLSGVKRTCHLHLSMSAFGRIADMGLFPPLTHAASVNCLPRRPPRFGPASFAYALFQSSRYQTPPTRTLTHELPYRFPNKNGGNANPSNAHKY